MQAVNPKDWLGSQKFFKKLWESINNSLLGFQGYVPCLRSSFCATNTNNCIIMAIIQFYTVIQ